MKETLPYRGYIDCIEMLKQENYPLAIVYFMSIAGREDELQHEWNKGPLGLEKAKKTIFDNILGYQWPYICGTLSGKLAVFGIAFPRCTRLFWWGKPLLSQYESNLFEFYNSNPQLDPLGSNFIGCGLENLIIAEETKLWYGAETVEEYYSLPRNPDLKIELKKRDKLGCKLDYKPN
jgi:hypothetical protein